MAEVTRAKVLAFSILIILLMANVPLFLAPARSLSADEGRWSLIQFNRSTTIPASMPGFKYLGPLNGSTVVVGAVYVPLRNLPLLFYYAYATNEPGSPLYHHYLNASRVAELFYPAEQLERLTNYLKSHGVKILLTAADSIVVFEGPASTVEKLIGVPIGLFSNGSTSYYESLGPASVDGFPAYVSNVTGVLLGRPTFMVTLNDLMAVLKRYGALQGLSAPLEAYNLTQIPGAYNVTPLYRANITGSGVSVGILDFYGSPYIAQTLAYFDKLYGLPNPPNFSVVPIGPYNPNLGVYTGWNYEVDLDVEAVHAIAPNASIVLYVASGELPLSAAIAFIDQHDVVSIVSQSFGVPESLFSNLGFEFYFFNVYLTDIYYALGSAEGITFVAASGDGGGMGYSAGPIGGVTYPASSPYVLSVGGTTTYIDYGPGNYTSYEQTAWSSMGFVPYLLNLGGSTGGYSAWEPMPWYQQGIVPRPPSGYPDGRAVPDVAANANIIPGVYAVLDGNQTEVTGGTSEAAPLTAGLLALVEQYIGQKLGLVNPVLYQLYSNVSTRDAFIPITFGYNIPWIAEKGYNLVTGLGAINAGLLAYYLKRYPYWGPEKLSVIVYVNGSSSNSTKALNLLPGDVVNISALVLAPNGTRVSQGQVWLNITTPEGVALYDRLEYNSTTGLWTTVLRVPYDVAGNSLIEVLAEWANMSGLGIFETYIGYFASFNYPSADEAWSSYMGVPLMYMITTLNGTPAPNNLSYTFKVLRYRPLTNSYELEYSKGLLGGGLTGELVSNESVGGLFLIELSGPVLGYVPFMDGIGLQTMYILPQVLAMPGIVDQGGYITVIGLPAPPLESYSLVSQQLGTPLSTAIEYGSNITALLVSPSGQVVSEAQIPLNESGYYYGRLPVPADATPGFYWVILEADYNSSTEGLVLGEGVGMIYVSQPVKAEVVVRPEYPAEGQPVTVFVNVTLNGTEVTYGALSATLLPESASYLYEYATQYVEVPLYYNTSVGEWVGTVLLPSPFSSGDAEAYDGLYVGQPWTLVVSGEGSTGGALVTGGVQIMQTRYIYYSHENLTYGNFYPYFGLFSYDNLTFNGTIVDSVFEGINGVYRSDLVIEGSQIRGLLLVIGSNVTLLEAQAMYIVAYDSNVTVVSSWIRSLELLNGSKVRYLGPTVYVFAGNQTSVLQDLEELWNYVKHVNDELQNYVEQLRFEIEQVNATLSARISQMESAASSYGTEAQRLQSQLQQLSGLESSLSQLEVNLTMRLYNVSERLNSISSTIESLEANESQLAADEESLRTNVTSLYTSVSALGARLGALSGQLEQLSGQIQLLNVSQEELGKAQLSVSSMTEFAVWLSVASVLAMMTVLTASYYTLRRLRS